MRTKKRLLYLLCSVFLLLGLFLGCASRDDELESAPGSTSEADEALAKAEQVMADAGVEINFRDLQGLGSLADLRQVLPSPLEIAVLEDEQIDEAVDSLYAVLDALGQPVSPAAPILRLGGEVSRSDLAMVHLHLGYLYVLGAIARLERVKGDLYEIEFPDEGEFDPDDPSVYRFRLTEQGQARIDEVSRNPNAEAGDFLQLFSPEQRQAVLDALRLLVDAEVVVEADPRFGIPDEERHAVVTAIYRRDALFHLVESLKIAQDIIPELEEALEKLFDTVGEYLARDMLDQIKEWGFRIDNEAEVIARIESLMQ